MGAAATSCPEDISWHLSLSSDSYSRSAPSSVVFPRLRICDADVSFGVEHCADIYSLCFDQHESLYELPSTAKQRDGAALVYVYKDNYNERHFFKFI